MLKRSITIGVVGYTGQMGKWHACLLHKAAYSMNLAARFHFWGRREVKLFKAQKFYSDPRAFVDSGLDLLVVALHPEHRLVIFQALARRRRQLQIFLEKPLSGAGQDNAAAENLRGLEKKFAACTLVHFPENFDPLTEAILRILQGQALPVPRLQVREILMSRAKDREDAGLGGNYRHTEPIILQEGIHDIAFLLYVLRQSYGRHVTASVINSLASPLQHPHRGKMGGSGSSHTLIIFRASTNTCPAFVYNSFTDAYLRKEKILVCRGDDGKNYTVNANFQPYARRSLTVYREGKPVDLAMHPWVKAAVLAGRDMKVSDMTGPAWTPGYMQRLLKNVSAEIKMSNFALAEQAERVCIDALQLQR